MTIAATLLNDKYKVLFDYSSDAHIIFEDGGITDCNDAMVNLLNAKDKSQILSLHPAVLSPEYQPDGQLSLEKAKKMDERARQKGYHRFEWVHRKLTGEFFPVEVTLNFISLNGKDIWIAVWHDLTESKQKEESLLRYRDRVQTDLALASEIQRSLLPQNSPYFKGIRSSWIFEPCDELGGDSVNIFALDDSHVGFYILDVAGHGIRAALLSVAASHLLSPYSEHSFLRGLSGRKISEGTILCPHEVLERLNAQFCAQPAFTQYFTLTYGIIDVRTRELAYASAGHTPILRLSGQEAHFLRSGGLPIGILAQENYPVERLTLKQGDRIYLYSDGVTEAKTARGEMFGEQKLTLLLQSARKDTLEKALYKTVAAIKNCYDQNHKLVDDVTLLGIEAT